MKIKFDKERIINFIRQHYIISSCLVVILLTIVLDYAFPKQSEIYKPFKFMFYGAYGFLTCALMVIVAKLMGFIVKRKENYYQVKFKK